MKHKKIKRLMSIVLVCVMLISIMPNTLAVYAEDEKDYTYIEELLAADENIEFDAETQTIAVIDTKLLQSEHLRNLEINDVEKLLAEGNIEYVIEVNGAVLPKDTEYYIVSKDTNTIETQNIDGWGSKAYNPKICADENKVAVFVLNQGDSYSISCNFLSANYYSKTYTHGLCNGERFCFHLKNDEKQVKFEGIADESIIETYFSFEWDLCNYLDIEIWLPDEVTRQYDNPGFINKYGYINFKFELRDENGNIMLLPQTFYNNYGSDDEIHYMEQDGIVPIPLEVYDDELLPHSTPYGEFDVYIPYGYDYRISLMDYSVDTLGGYAYVMNQEHEYDEDGFCITDKTVEDSNEWGSWLAYNFMPCSKEIRVDKKVEGASASDNYTFTAAQNVCTFSAEQYVYSGNMDLTQLLIGYPYDLYDSKTNEKLNTAILKTDSNGRFTLKDNQYAVFKVWEAPADLADYTQWGTNFVSEVYMLIDDVATESKYTFEESEDSNCITTVKHVRGENESTVDGKKIENVRGNDKILFTNSYLPQANGIGNLTVSVTKSANDTNKEFTFTITLSDTTINGTYGDVEFIDGVATFTLKHGESKTATALPEGTEYTVAEGSNSGYDVSVNNVNGMTISGAIVANTTSSIAFANAKTNGGNGTGGSNNSSGNGGHNGNGNSENHGSSTGGNNSGNGSGGGNNSSGNGNGVGGNQGSSTGNSDNGNGNGNGNNAGNSNGNNVGSNSGYESGNANVENESAGTAVQPGTPSNSEQSTDNVPQTDDKMNVTLWISLLGISMIGILISCGRNIGNKKHRS